MAQSPDGKVVVSGGADETLRFWKIFDIETNPIANIAAGNKSSHSSSKTSFTRSLNIR